MREKMMFTFSLPVTLTFDVLTSNLLPIYSCQALCFHWNRSFYGFSTISRKWLARDWRADRQPGCSIYVAPREAT